MVFVIKRLIYIEFRVPWKGKKKRFEGAGGPGRATSHSGYFVATNKLCCDRVSYVATGSQAARATQSGRARWDA